MANSNGWGDGAANNAIGWGQGANNAIGWGDIHADSWAGLTDIVGITTDPDAQAFITAAAITDSTQQSAINQLVVDLKGYNIWTKFSALYPFVGGTNAQHTWNLKNTAQYKITWAGGVTSSSLGVKFNGTNSYGNTGFNPSLNSSLNSNGLGFYSGTNLSETSADPVNMGGLNIGDFYVILKSNTTLAGRLNATSISASSAIMRGFFSAQKTAATITTIYKESTSLATGNSGGALPNVNLFLGTLNLGGTPYGSGYIVNDMRFAYISDGLNSTEIGNLYTAVQAFQTTLGRQVGTPIPYTSFPLDTYSGAEAAYSLRRLRTAYTGSLIRVRRSSDNTEMDFGYNSNNVLDTASLLTFCGAGSGFVTTWYDQSGNAKNATQTTAANQPIIVTNGTVELNNGMPNLNFNQDFLSIGTQVNLTGQHYMVYVGNSTNVEQSTAAGMIYYNANNDPSIRIGAGDNGRGILSYYNGGYQVNAETDVQLYSIITHAMTGSFTSTFYRNATQVATGSATGALGNVTSFFIGTYSGASDTRNGNCQELIVWASDQSTNRTAITNNINGFYSAY